MTDETRDLADVKTGNISLQPIKTEDEKPIAEVSPVIYKFPPPPEIPPGEFQNGTFLPGSEKNDLLSSKGITAARPEIIAYTKFERCYEGIANKELPILEMIRTQIAARRLREENINKFVEYLKEDPQTQKIIESLITIFNSNIESTKEDIEDIKRVWTDFDRFIYALDIYQTRGGIYQQAKSTQGNPSEIFTLDDVFSRQGFNSKNIQFWTSTKTLGQLILDVSHATQKYTHGLFISKPQLSGQWARAIDVDPLTYNFSQYQFNLQNQVGFSFNIWEYVNSTEPTNGFLEWKLNGTKFVSSNRSRKLRLVCNTLSKVLGGSRIYANQQFRNKFLTVTQKSIDDTKNYIADIAGTPQTPSILAEVLPQTSALGTLKIGTQGGPGLSSIINPILPLERRDVVFNDTGNVTNAMAGYDYFFQGLLSQTSGDSFNTQRINKFKKDLFDRLGTALDMIDVSCLTDTQISRDVNGQQTINTLKSDSLLLDARKTLLNSNLLKLSNLDANSLIELQYLRAIFYYASINNNIKSILFQLLFLHCVGIQISSVNPLQTQIITSITTNEVKTYSNLPNFGNSSYKNELIINGNRITQSINSLIDDLVLELNKIIPNTKLNSKNLGFESNQQIDISLTQEKNILRTAFAPYKRNFLNLFQFINNIEKRAGTVNSAAGSGQTGIIFENQHVSQNGTSRFMNLSSSMRLMFYFELFITLLGSYRFSYIKKQVSTSGKLQFNVINDVNRITNFSGNLNISTIPQTGQFGGGTSNDIAVQLNNDITALRQDRTIIQSITCLLRAYINKLSRYYGGKITKTGILSNLTTTSQDPIVLNDREARRVLVSKQQTALSLVEFDDIQRSLQLGATFSEDATITPVIQNLLEKLLKISAYKTQQMRIMSVGLCPGTNSIIEAQDKTSKDGKQRRNWRQSDIINVDVYIKNILEEDIIFKPQQFTFELSRFVNTRSFDRLTSDIVNTKDYDFITNDYVDFIDVSSMLAGNLERTNGRKTRNFDRYEFLDKSTLDKIFRNHTTSYLLGLYIKLLSGIDIREKSFLLEPQVLETVQTDDTLTKFRQLSEILLRKNSPTLTLQQFRAKYPEFDKKLKDIESGKFGAGIFDEAKIIDPAVFNEVDILVAKDLYDISKLMSSKTTLTAGEKVRKRITSPKLFERIFNIPVNLLDFEIDLEQTYGWDAGIAAMNRLQNTGMLTIIGNKHYYRWNRENIKAEQLWTTISTLDV